MLLALAHAAPAQYVGAPACKTCHPSQFAAQSASAHARALAISPDPSRGYWAFGAGDQATTYVSQLDEDSYLEHGLSFYSATKSMALTPGHTDRKGVRYRTFAPDAAILRCFQCHSTGSLKIGPGRAIQPAELGVRCESCHGSGGRHVQSGGARDAIFNPRRLSAAELNDFCGACHRKPPSAGDETDWTNPWNLRHEPLYLSQSACFRKSEGRLSCVTCHSPHEPLEHRSTSYDQRCATCHEKVRHRAPAAAKSCISCHMPRVAPRAELHFANHWIGIYAGGDRLRPRRVQKP